MESDVNVEEKLAKDPYISSNVNKVQTHAWKNTSEALELPKPEVSKTAVNMPFEYMIHR